MDETDIQLILLLLGNSRQPYRELGDRLGLSVNAVYKRMQGLIDTGVIAKFTTSINLKYYNGIAVWMFGHSISENLDKELQIPPNNACECYNT